MDIHVCDNDPLELFLVHPKISLSATGVISSEEYDTLFMVLRDFSRFYGS